jgi:hypothetical protein
MIGSRGISSAGTAGIFSWAGVWEVIACFTWTGWTKRIVDPTLDWANAVPAISTATATMPANTGGSRMESFLLEQKAIFKL